MASCPECTWSKGADGICFDKGLRCRVMSSSRATEREQFQYSSPLTGTVQQLSAALTQGLKEEGRKERVRTAADR